MTALARLVGLGLVLLLGQLLARELFPAYIRPDLLLIYALALGLRGGHTQGLVLAFLAGFVQDTLSAAPLGLYALLRGTGSGLTRLFDKALYLRATAPWAIYVGVYAILDWALLGVLQRLFAPDSAIPWQEALLRAPGTALASALVAAPLLRVFRWSLSEGDRETSWPALAPQSPQSRQ